MSLPEYMCGGAKDQFHSWLQERTERLEDQKCIRGRWESRMKGPLNVLSGYSPVPTRRNREGSGSALTRPWGRV